MIKQDINFLDKPLWLLNESNQENFVWQDLDGYEYRSGYKPPDVLDMLFLFYMLDKSQKLGYKEKIELTRYEVLKACNRTTDNKSYERLKDSLERWANVFIKFNGTFYDGKDYTEIGFHIIENYKFIKENSQLEVNFNNLWLLKIKESKFFKYIDFEYYKALKRPISRRLFEILCKTFKGRNSWDIDLVKLGTKLTLSKRKRHLKGGGIKEVMFHSDVLVKVKAAVNEINKLAQDEKLFQTLEITAREAFIIDYELKKDNKIIRFIKRIPDWVKQKNSQEIKPKLESEQKEISFEEDTTLTKLYDLLKSPTKGLREEIGKYYREKGFEYVNWNIEYANKMATKNYTTYLKKCLKENWGGEFREVETTKIESEKVHQEVKNKDMKASQAKDKEILELNKRYKSLPEAEQTRLFEEAKEFYLAQGLKEKFMNKEMIMTKVRELIRGSYLSVLNDR